VSSYDDRWSAGKRNTPESFRIDQADNNIFKLSQKIVSGKALARGPYGRA
jgi:hypothetical protein